MGVGPTYRLSSARLKTDLRRLAKWDDGMMHAASKFDGGICQNAFLPLPFVCLGLFSFSSFCLTGQTFNTGSSKMNTNIHINNGKQVSHSINFRLHGHYGVKTRPGFCVKEFGTGMIITM